MSLNVSECLWMSLNVSGCLWIAWNISSRARSSNEVGKNWKRRSKIEIFTCKKDTVIKNTTHMLPRNVKMMKINRLNKINQFEKLIHCDVPLRRALGKLYDVSPGFVPPFFTKRQDCFGPDFAHRDARVLKNYRTRTRRRLPEAPPGVVRRACSKKL